MESAILTAVLFIAVGPFNAGATFASGSATSNAPTIVPALSVGHLRPRRALANLKQFPLRLDRTEVKPKF